MAGRILLVDDEVQLRKLLSRILSLEGFQVSEAGDLRGARLQLEKHETDLVLCDVKLPDGNGVPFVSEIKASYPGLEVILLTAYGNITDGVQAIKNGAFDYICKGNDNDRIIPLAYQALEKVNAYKRNAVKIDAGASIHFNGIIGMSPPLLEAIALAKKAAGSNASVLLLGETGTGKEVLANAIHGASRRSGKPFIAINCSAFPRDLLEAELFGHKAGAFTGALRDRKGLLEQANGGTLFLDEIGEMPAELQAKILRVLESGTFIKLGDTQTTHVDLRIISATNRNLEQAIRDGRFREDLLYRLNIFTILLPPLRSRPADIPLLAEAFVRQFAEREGRKPLQIDSQTLALLQKYPWKGNVRELKNVLERACILAEGGMLLPQHLPYNIQQNDTTGPGLSLAEVEKAHIVKVLQYAGGNKTKAANILGIGLSTLYRKMEEYLIPK